MRLSWNEIRERAADFDREWADAAYEKGETQRFYNEFFDIFGVRRRTVARYKSTTSAAPNVLTTPERAVEMVGARLNADHYQWFRGRTKGEVSPKELREVEAQAQEAAASSVGAPKPKRRKGRRLNQADKVATLKGGRQWYRYLSERFSHGKTADWRGLSWRGGVMTIDRVEDEFAFLSLFDYLVKQVALMNAHAALCPVAGDEDDQWSRWVEPALAELRDVRESSRALREAGMSAQQERLDGSARTD